MSLIAGVVIDEDTVLRPQSCDVVPAFLSVVLAKDAVQVFAQQVFDCLCHVSVPFGARFTFDERRYGARTHRKSRNQVDGYNRRAFNALRPELWTLGKSP